jgi:endonuclease/exonuclease/phosphatase family metal-dependent hydrolase
MVTTDAGGDVAVIDLQRHGSASHQRHGLGLSGLNGQTLQLMSVHLKSGCFENRSASSACETLLAQVPVLEGWIDAAAQGPMPFIVLGDFNRRFTLPHDVVWTELDDGEPANADLTTLTQDMPISCRDNTFTEFIDHLVVDWRVLPWVDRTSFRHTPIARPTRPSGKHSPTTARCSSSCGFDNGDSVGNDERRRRA